MQIKSFISSLNSKTKYDLYFGQYDAKVPLTFVFHGFKGFKDWGFLPYVSKEIAKNIGPAVNVDFAYNGIVSSKPVHYNTELFRKNTMTFMLDEIKDLVEEVNNDNLNKEINDFWNGEIYLFGHSLGGALSIITAKENSEINKICIWGSISKTDRNTKRQKDEWREKGILEFKDTISGDSLILDVSYLEDKEENEERFHLLNNMSKLKIPVSIIHGNQDLTVNKREAERLIKASENNPNREYHFISKCGHTFGTAHPMEKVSKQLEESLNLTLEFFRS